MADQNYIYHGPTSGVTLVLPDGRSHESREVMLYDGKPVSLPPKHPHVVGLVARGHLTIAPSAIPSAAAALSSASSGSTRKKERS